MAMRVEEEARFRLWINPALTAEQRMEVNSAICRFLIDPPQPPRRRGEVAVRQSLNLYEGARSSRAKELERRYRAYLAAGWPREHDLESLPHPRTTERACEGQRSEPAHTRNRHQASACRRRSL
jgi:hypothetical protein